VIDRGVSAGALGMSRAIANFPGFVDPVPGAELVARLGAQAQAYGAVFTTDHVTASSFTDTEKIVWGTQGRYVGKTLIVATGSMGRSAPLPGEEKLTGRGVSYCATCDGFFFRDRDVAVIGGTDEAAEEALVLSRLARRVTMLVPTESLRAPEELVARLEALPNVEILRSAVVEEIVGTERVEGVRVRTRGSAATTLAVDGVFLYLQGTRPIVEFLAGQAKLSPEGCLAVDEFLQTSVPGVFAAGDVLCKHLKQAVIAAAEGARAAVAADRYLSGRAKLRPDWS